MPEGTGKARQLLTINYHQDTNRIVARLLRSRGHEVFTAGTFSEAEQIISMQAIDLALCRMTAPDGDGAEFIERIYRKYGVPSVAVSGSIENQSRAARLSSRAVRGLLWIPINVNIMYLAIATALSGSRHRVGVCPDCDGQGSVLLLTTKRECRRCDGSGIEIPTVDTGLSATNAGVP
jgi:CheY-like chemotaxis protein